MWWNNGMGWGGMGSGAGVGVIFAMVAFLAVVAVVVVVLLRHGRTTAVSGSGLAPTSGANTPSANPSSANPSGAEKILDERFARGEIDAEEYQARRTLLSSTHRR